MNHEEFGYIVQNLARRIGMVRGEVWTVVNLSAEGAQPLYGEMICGKARLSVVAVERLTVVGLGPQDRPLRRGWQASYAVGPHGPLWDTLRIAREINRRIISAGYIDDVLVAEDLAFEPARDYSRRQLRNITITALEQLARLGSGAGQEMRSQARAALAQLDGKPAEHRGLVWRHQVQPGLHVVIEDSHNVLLELTTPDGSEVIARTDPIGGEDLPEAITLARVKVSELEEQDYQDRLDGLRERLASRRQPG